MPAMIKILEGERRFGDYTHAPKTEAFESILDVFLNEGWRLAGPVTHNDRYYMATLLKDTP